MEIRADLGVPARLRPEAWRWVGSPQPGVTRVMLDRVGEEVAVATSFVRYEPGSCFPGHDHARGEEFVVMEGVFADEHGSYPAGSYVRNPPGSRHAPFSEPGCMIWVKLRQFQEDDDRTLRTRLDTPLPASGRSERLLHEHGAERVLEMVAAEGEALALPARPVPQEVLVLAGTVLCDGESYGPGGWLREPAGSGLRLKVLSPCRVLWKTRPGK